jgi:hypothetical protein
VAIIFLDLVSKHLKLIIGCLNALILDLVTIELGLIVLSSGLQDFIILAF